MINLDRLGGWRHLPFFDNDLHRILSTLAGTPFLPPADQIFAALEKCQPAATRVVILGQDPYHTPGKADGLAFSIREDFGGRLDSLGNIFKELQSDLDVARTRTALDDWADQGVLLLNTALTVAPGQPKSHATIGWMQLVLQAIELLNKSPRAYMLWGGPAHKFAPHIHGEHLILRSAHPSPLSAYRGFFGSRPFSTVNQWLIEQGQPPINWADP